MAIPLNQQRTGKHHTKEQLGAKTDAEAINTEDVRVR